MQVKAPLSTRGVGMVPAQHEDAGKQQQQADPHELQVASHGHIILGCLRPALQQIGDQQQFDRRQQGKPQQVQGDEHAQQRGLDGKHHGQKRCRVRQLPHPCIQHHQQRQHGGEQYEQDAHAIDSGMVVEQGQ